MFFFCLLVLAQFFFCFSVSTSFFFYFSCSVLPYTYLKSKNFCLSTSHLLFLYLLIFCLSSFVWGEVCYIYDLVILVVFTFIDAMSRERGVVMVIVSPEYVVCYVPLYSRCINPTVIFQFPYLFEYITHKYCVT
jgi:hypothetical protein